MQAYASDLQNSPFINPAGPVWELHFADERAPWHASCPKLSQPWLRTVCAGHSIRIASFTRRLIRAGTHRCTAPSVVCLKGGCVRFAFPARHGGSWLILKLDHCLADGARAMCGAVRSLDANRYRRICGRDCPSCGRGCGSHRRGWLLLRATLALCA
jgi:hypothetical protein